MGFSIKAMWTNKCPRCRQGNIFTTPLKLSAPLEMPKTCEYCGQRTEPEPGFYFGAMFVSYILSSWFLLLPTLLLVFYFKWTLEAAMAFTVALGMVSYLKFLRGSRSLWFHMMVKHDPIVENKVKTKMEETKGQEWKPNIIK